MRKYQKGSPPPRSLLGFPLNKSGFTLIELLVVIAVIGVLAGVVLIAVNPAEQINRAKDANSIQGASSVFNVAVSATTLNNGAPLPASGQNGQQAFVDSGDLKQIVTTDPSVPNYQVDNWTAPPNTYVQVVTGPMKAILNKQRAIKIHTAGGGISNCDGTQTNTIRVFNSAPAYAGQEVWWCS